MARQRPLQVRRPDVEALAPRPKGNGGTGGRPNGARRPCGRQAPPGRATKPPVGSIAQSVELRTFNPLVRGSSPRRPTKRESFRKSALRGGPFRPETRERCQLRCQLRRPGVASGGYSARAGGARARRSRAGCRRRPGVRARRRRTRRPVRRRLAARSRAGSAAARQLQRRRHRLEAGRAQLTGAGLSPRALRSRLRIPQDVVGSPK